MNCLLSFTSITALSGMTSTVICPSVGVGVTVGVAVREGVKVGVALGTT